VFNQIELLQKMNKEMKTVTQQAGTTNIGNQTQEKPGPTRHFNLPMNMLLDSRRDPALITFYQFAIPKNTGAPRDRAKQRWPE